MSAPWAQPSAVQGRGRSVTLLLGCLLEELLAGQPPRGCGWIGTRAVRALTRATWVWEGAERRAGAALTWPGAPREAGVEMRVPAGFGGRAEPAGAAPVASFACGWQCQAEINPQRGPGGRR